MLLAAFGLYGVMSYTIVRRTGEFGLRIALGARPGDVTRLVLRESLSLFLVGAAVGLPVAVGAVRLLRGQLVGVGLVDPPSIAAALLVLAASAAAAGYRPASRAARKRRSPAMISKRRTPPPLAPGRGRTSTGCITPWALILSASS